MAKRVNPTPIVQLDENNDIIGAGGTSMTDDGAFTVGSSSVTPVAGMYDNASVDSVSEGDVGVFRMTADRQQLVVRGVDPQAWSYHADSTTTVKTDDEVKADPGDGFAIYVGTIVFSTGAATASSIFFEEGASKVLGPYYTEAVAGRGCNLVFDPPKKITASTALTVTNTGSTTYSIDVTGFVAPG